MPHPSTGANAGTGGPAAGTQLGWNYVFDMVGNKLDYYEAKSPDGTLPYRATDFAALFRP